MLKVKPKSKKSKAACLRCRERRIKCDQHVPICHNCEKRNIECPYQFLTPYQIDRMNKEQKALIELVNGENNNYSNKQTTPPDQQQNKDYNYHLNGTINLNTEPLHLDDTIYHSHEMENILLSSSMRNNIVSENIDDYNYKEIYIPLSTNFGLLLDSNIKTLDLPLLTEKLNLPLYSNSRVSNKTFKIDRTPEIEGLNFRINEFYQMLCCLITNDFESLIPLLNGKNIDHTLYKCYIGILTMCQLFNKLLRKSFLLFSMDYYKNVLLKQDMIMSARCDAKLAISCVCENGSVLSIDEITQMLKTEYLPLFDVFCSGSKNIFLGNFMLLDDCLGYHFKNGLKFDLSFQQCNKAVGLVGIFSTGFYSIIMARSEKEILYTSANVLSSYLVTFFRKILIQNYDNFIFDEFKGMVKSVGALYGKNINYDNLLLFCEKHSPLLKANIHKDTLLGYNNGYIIRIFNSFLSILPFDITNFMVDDLSVFDDKENDIVIGFLYSTMAQILEVIIPGKYLMCGSFSGSELNMYDISNVPNVMILFKKIKTKRLQLLAIYLIRAGLFFKIQWMFYRACLINITASILLMEEESMSINERYQRLKKFKCNGVADEVQMKSFLLRKGQFIRKMNYPNYNGLKPKRLDRVSNNKILKHFNDDEDALIADFIETNTGFLSMDFDVSEDVSVCDIINKEATYIDSTQMKILWKLSTYIRINNL